MKIKKGDKIDEITSAKLYMMVQSLIFLISQNN